MDTTTRLHFLLDAAYDDVLSGALQQADEDLFGDADMPDNVIEARAQMLRSLDRAIEATGYEVATGTLQ